MAAKSLAWYIGCRCLNLNSNLLHPSIAIICRQRPLKSFIRSLSHDLNQAKVIRRTYGNVSGRPEALDVETAVGKVREAFSNTYPEPMLYVGIGQYFTDPDRERVVVLQACTEFSGYQHSILLDASFKSSNVDELMKQLEGINRDFWHGELNCVGNSEWNHGFTVKPDFRIFTGESWHCELGTDRLRVLTNESFEELSLKDIQSVNVYLSEEPWNEQGIYLHLKDDSFFELLQFEIINDNRDLAMLMIDTEWTVKAAAILCLKIRKLGIEVQLRLPKELTIHGNPWVEDRHKTWTRLITSV